MPLPVKADAKTRKAQQFVSRVRALSAFPANHAVPKQCVEMLAKKLTLQELTLLVTLADVDRTGSEYAPWEAMPAGPSSPGRKG